MVQPGDMPLQDRLDEGGVDLSHFMPDGDSDAYTAITQSAMRRWIYLDEQSRAPHQSTSRAGQSSGLYCDTPDHVVTHPIEVDGRTWNYQMHLINPASLRRVFAEKDQAIELDLDETLVWLSTTPNTRRYEEIKGRLQAEVDDVSNQVIMQVMYQRYEAGLPIFDRSGKVLGSTQ